MKKFFIALALLLGTASPAHALRGDVPVPWACGNDNSNASITVAPAVSGRAYRLYGVYLSANVADEVTVGMGADEQFGIFLGDTSGVVHNLYPLFLKGDQNEAISITKTGATDLHYCVLYDLEW